MRVRKGHGGEGSGLQDRQKTLYDHSQPVHKVRYEDSVGGVCGADNVDIPETKRTSTLTENRHALCEKSDEITLTQIT